MKNTSFKYKKTEESGFLPVISRERGNCGWEVKYGRRMDILNEKDIFLFAVYQCFPACRCMYHVQASCAQMPEEFIKSTETVATVDGALPYGGWELNPGLLLGQ